MGLEETSFSKVLAWGAGGLSSIIRIHVEKQSSLVVCAYNPIVGEVEIDRSPGLTGQPD